MGRMGCNLTPDQAMDQASEMAEAYLKAARESVVRVWGREWVRANPREAAILVASAVQAAGANFQSLVMMSISGEGR